MHFPVKIYHVTNEIYVVVQFYVDRRGFILPINQIKQVEWENPFSRIYIEQPEVTSGHSAGRSFKLKERISVLNPTANMSSDNSNGNCCDNCPCFPGYGNSIVTLESGKTYIEDVKVGDLAKVVLDDGSFGYSEVWTLAHHNPATETNFIQIETENRRLNISPRHFLVVNRNDERIDLMAKDVKVGDELIVYDELLYKDAAGTEKVVDIELVDGKGVFAPFTKQGRLIVNGVLVSCYAEVNPSLAHTALAPLRAMYDVTPTAVMDTLMTHNANGVPHVFNTTFNVVKSFVTE